MKRNLVIESLFAALQTIAASTIFSQQQQPLQQLQQNPQIQQQHPQPPQLQKQQQHPQQQQQQQRQQQQQQQLQQQQISAQLQRPTVLDDIDGHLIYRCGDILQSRCMKSLHFIGLHRTDIIK